MRPYECIELPIEQRQQAEKAKREFLQLEDLKIGDGALAGWCRRISADVEARYTDGSVFYNGKIKMNEGFSFSPDKFVPQNWEDSQVLSVEQRGLRLGLNGMAVGGKRRIVINPNLVCSISNDCDFTNPGKDGGTKVRKETLFVEAILKEVCVPRVYLSSSPVS